MKNKRFTYILIVAVSAIWIGVIVQIITWNSHEVLPMNQNPPKKIQRITQVEEFPELSLEYRDPFLERSYRKPKKIITVKKIQKPQKNIRIIEWPTMEYNGSISKSSSKMALVKINGKELLLKEGDEENGIVITRIYNDSIQLAYMSTRKTVYK